MNVVQIVGDQDLSHGILRISMNIDLTSFAAKLRVALAEKRRLPGDFAREIFFNPENLELVLYGPLFPEIEGLRCQILLDLFKLIEEIAKALGVTVGSLLPEPTARKPESKGPIIIHRPTRVVDR